MSLTLEQALEDIAFLVKRAGGAGGFGGWGRRSVGMSSNALVSLAYGGIQDQMPHDRDDYAACVRAVRQLPRHRRTQAVLSALADAKVAYRREASR